MSESSGISWDSGEHLCSYEELFPFIWSVWSIWSISFIWFIQFLWMEYWVSKTEKALLLVQERSPCGVGLPPLHGASLRITEFILRNEGPEAQGKIFLAFNLYRGNTYYP